MISYTDNVLVARNEEEHHQHLETLFVINPVKCMFGIYEVNFLGYSISSKRIRLLPEKVEPIDNFLKPENAKQLRRFLETINFYNYQRDKITGLLRGNIKGKVPINWTDDDDRFQ